MTIVPANVRTEHGHRQGVLRLLPEEFGEVEVARDDLWGEVVVHVQYSGGWRRVYWLAEAYRPYEEIRAVNVIVR